jgi:secreted trypsin-like serine protease
MVGRKARWGLVSGLLLVLMIVGWAAPARAITWGDPDDTGLYPFVGAFMVELNDGRVLQFCSGTLIHERVFLTAAHCTDYVEELMDDGRVVAVYVSFDWDVTPDANPALLDVAEIITHPDYAWGGSNPHDVGALVLAEPVEGIDPVAYADEGFLETLKKERQLREGRNGARFEVVGYGGILAWPPPQITYEDQRRYASSEYVALVPTWLHLSQNRLHDNGGTCFGDSGGPGFWRIDDETVILVGITSWGDAQCVATGFDYRVDIPDTLDFIDDVIGNLP